MPAADTTSTTVGPVDDELVRPVRTRLLINGVGPAVMLVVAVVLGVTYWPSLAIGLGAGSHVRATVVSVIPVPGAENRVGRDCDTNRITVEWGGHHRATDQLCQTAQGGDPSAGDTVHGWAIAGSDHFVIGSRTRVTVLALFLVLLFLASAWGTAWIARQLSALATIRKRAHTVPALQTARSTDVSARSRRRRVRVVFEDERYAQLVVSLPMDPGATELWEHFVLHPTRRTVRGRWAGPYVLRSAQDDQVFAVGLGRALRETAR